MGWGREAEQAAVCCNGEGLHRQQLAWCCEYASGRTRHSFLQATVSTFCGLR